MRSLPAPRRGLINFLGGPHRTDGAFSREARADDVDADGDMRLFQWSLSDWGDRASFMYDIMRQLMPQPASHDAELHRCIGQRSPTLKFPPAAEVEEIVAGNRWRYHSCELADFLACISECEATAALKERVPVGASLWSGYAE